MTSRLQTTIKQISTQQEGPVELPQTQENADAWCEALAAVSMQHPEAFNTPAGIQPDQLEEARRYFFTA